MMRAALWLLALFGFATVLALFAGNNEAVVTLFWPPHRIDLSLNFALLLLAIAAAVVYAALRAVLILLSMPDRARQWRMLQHERAAHDALVRALNQAAAGRFARAKNSAELAHDRAALLRGEQAARATRLMSLAQLLAAQNAHALGDQVARQQHYQAALDLAGDTEVREALSLLATRWALDRRAGEPALAALAELPQGAARRTLALRFKLKAQRLSGQALAALGTARLLVKHRAFSDFAAPSLIRALALEVLAQARDMEQLQAAWQSLQVSERTLPAIALQAAQQCLALGGPPELARAWVLPLWERGAGLEPAQMVELVRLLEQAQAGQDDAWLARIEAAQQALPRDPWLAYLAGMSCMQRQLWGKAQQLLGLAAPLLHEADLRRRAWGALAVLAQQRGDPRQRVYALQQAVGDDQPKLAVPS